MAQFIAPKLKVVDYGCNDGDLLNLPIFDACGFAYTGIDINAAFIKLAKQRHPTGKFMVGNALTDETNDWLLRHRPGVIVASGVLCYKAGAASYPELVYRLFNAVTEALIFNVLVNTKPVDKAVHVWTKHKVLALIDACGCHSWEIKRGYLSNDMTVVMRTKFTHAVQ